MIDLRPLDESNFGFFLTLLAERGEAPEDYYKWKYIDQPSSRIKGFVAFNDSKPAGCIGIINRIYTDHNGRESEAAWFADWFVTRSARGLGIGQLLMEKVRLENPLTFGIPGPATAQTVCQKSGYRVIEGFEEHTVYFNAFRAGFMSTHRSLFRKIARGVRSWLKYNDSFRNVNSKETGIYSNSFPPGEQWMLAIEKIIECAHLKRNPDFIDWLKKMPLQESKKRQWWWWSGKSAFACGFTESDFWGLRKARILELVEFESSPAHGSITDLLSVLSSKKADLAVFNSMGLSDDFLYRHSEAVIPLYTSSGIPVEIEYLSGLDKESSWRDLTFHLPTSNSVSTFTTV